MPSRLVAPSGTPARPSGASAVQRARPGAPRKLTKAPTPGRAAGATAPAQRARPEAPGKRARLVAAGQQLLHQQGFERTTLAHVAALAGVPLGNVYYYFKTKEALCQAIVEAHAATLTELFSGWEQSMGPRECLVSLVRGPRKWLDDVLAYGCPHGSLCQELEKLGPESPLAQAGVKLMGIYVKWAEAQFRALGWGARSEGRAIDLIAALQGAMLLGHTFRSADMLTRALRRIERSLDKLPPVTASGRTRAKTTA